MPKTNMDRKTTALNIVDINRRISQIQGELEKLHLELDELHSMRNELIEELSKK